jgi:hypothetical protein
MVVARVAAAIFHGGTHPSTRGHPHQKGTNALRRVLIRCRGSPLQGVRKSAPTRPMSLAFGACPHRSWWPLELVAGIGGQGAVELVAHRPCDSGLGRLHLAREGQKVSWITTIDFIRCGPWHVHASSQRQGEDVLGQLRLGSKGHLSGNACLPSTVRLPCPTLWQV